MRAALRAVVVAGALALCAAPAHAAQAERAINIRDALLYLAPDASSQKLGRVGRGREVAIFDKTPGWLHVFAAVDQGRDVSGWMLDKGIVRTSTPDGDKIIFGEAVDSEAEASRRGGRKNAAQDAMRLYYRLQEYFPQSALAAEALYRAADIRWQIDAVDVMTRPSAKERDPNLRPDIDEAWMKRVRKEYPGTKWADLASYHLIDNKLCGAWEGLAKCPEKESEIYTEYARERPKSPKAPEALYNAAWRQAALIEIYKADGDGGKSAAAKNKALALAQRLITAYPESDHARRAYRLAYLIQQNVPTYGSAAE